MAAVRRYPARRATWLVGRCFLQKHHYFLSAATNLLILHPYISWFQVRRRTPQTPIFATRPLRNAWVLNGPYFFPARVRFSKRDSWLDFFKFAPRVWCDDSYGAAHRRVRGRQKKFKTNWILTVLFCGVPAATKLPFSASESHSFLTRCVFMSSAVFVFFIEICMC